MSSERSALSLKDAKATRALVIANIVIFAILRLAPGAREALLLDPAAVWAKPWTLVTVFFAHELPLNLVVNLAILVAFGSRLESRAGAGITSFAYALGGFLGALVIIPYAGYIAWTGPVVGASAAVFAILGAYAAVEPDERLFKAKIAHWFAAAFVANLAMTVMNPAQSIGGPAHAVGLLAGFGLGRLAKRRGSR